MADFSEKEYDIAFGWEYQPTDCLLGALFAHRFIGRNEKNDFGLGDITIAKGARVLLIGNYWSDEAVAGLLERTKNVFYYPMSKKDAVHYDHFPEHIDVVTYLEEDASAGYVWAAAILRRTHGEKSQDDEYLYRGLTVKRFEEDHDSLYEVFEALMALTPEEHEKEVESLMTKGRYTAIANQMNARALAKNHGVHFEWKGITFCAVQGPEEPVLDYTVAAAELANVGINVRYNHRDGITRLSFYTLTPDTISLDFVGKLFKDSGGRDHCKGGKLVGIRKFPKTSPEDLLTIIHQECAAPSL